VMTGDVDVRARVAAIQGGDAWAKAGVMIRESLAANSRNAFALVSRANGSFAQRRLSPGSQTTQTASNVSAPPGWVRLVRTGQQIASFYSANGTTWTPISTDTVTMSATVYVGLAVTAHSATTRTTATLDNVAMVGPSGNQPPTVSLTAPANGASFAAPATVNFTATAADPENRLSRVEFYNGTTLLNSDTTAPFAFTWSSVAAGTYVLKAIAYDADGGITSSATATITVGSSQLTNQDIGAPAMAGSMSSASGTYTVTAGGTDIWDTSDQFHFVYQAMTGDLDVRARVAAIQGGDNWAKAGVMIRESLAANSRNALALVSRMNGVYAQRRVSPGVQTTNTASGAPVASPGWVRLVRTGQQIASFWSADGTTWTPISTDTVTMAGTVYVGVAVTSHFSSATTTATIDSFTMQ